MDKERFVYVTYIAATPSQVWKALIDGELTRQYWKHTNESDWKPGSKWKHVAADGSTVKLVGTVIEVVPNRRLVLSWGDVADADQPARHSRVAIDIEPVTDAVRLTVTHDELAAGSKMARDIAQGWPRVVSSLKSFLETGRPLVTWG